MIEITTPFPNVIPMASPTSSIENQPHPRRVLLMTSSMRGGGSEQQTLLLLQHLDRSRFKPLLYVTDPSGPLLDQVPADVQILHHETSKNVSKGYLPGRILRKQSKHLKNLLVKHQIDVIYDRTFHMTLMAGPAGKSSKVPRVSTIVSPPDRALPLLERRFLWLKHRRLKTAYQNASCVITVSQECAIAAKKYYQLGHQTVLTISNPVDRQRIIEAASESKVQRDKRITLICVGRMTREKGHHDLIEALSSIDEDWPENLPSIHLWCIGDGPLRGELEDRCGALENHQVSFLGHQKNPWKYINAADALVLPSHFEGMPNVVLEAMTLRTPVIATRIGGTNELERDSPTIWWANPHSSESLANAMIEFASHPKEAMQRVESSERLIRSHHSVEQSIGQIEDQLWKACNSHSRSG